MSATVAISGLQECSYCRRDLTRSCRVSSLLRESSFCSPLHWSSPHTASCVDCVNTPKVCTADARDSVGVRIEEHRPWHQYRVSTNLSFPVFSEDWTAHEELLLLDAIKQSGLGNWKDISEKVESKTDKRCAEHYWDLYTGRYGAQLPPEFYTQTGEKVRNGQSRRMASAKKCLSAAVPRKVPTSELVDAELLGGDAYEREKFQSKQGRPTGDTQKEGKQANVGKKQGGGAPGAPAERLAGADISGYMPLRGDFDHEHENDAEELLADMTFEDEEPEADVELKLQVIRVFNRKLDEREKRKDFVVSRGLLVRVSAHETMRILFPCRPLELTRFGCLQMIPQDYKRVLAAERKRPRDERDIISRLRPFARFHSAEQHAKLIDSIIATKVRPCRQNHIMRCHVAWLTGSHVLQRLKERIDQLMYYRSIGFLNISDGMQYEEVSKGSCMKRAGILGVRSVTSGDPSRRRRR
eukprot:scaffold5138_cov251-Pinguiococcus_pyrenoidosus.AAC.6